MELEIKIGSTYNCRKEGLTGTVEGPGMFGSEKYPFKVLYSDGYITDVTEKGEVLSDTTDSHDLISEVVTQPEPLKLEVGKFYQAENGEVGECKEVDEDGESTVRFKSLRGQPLSFKPNGERWFPNIHEDYRIVREVPNPNQPAAVCEREVESETAAEVKKPPLGIKPKHLFDEQTNYRHGKRRKKRTCQRDS